MAVTVKIEGLKELDDALGELPKATGKNVLRRVLRKAAEPMAEQMRASAPVAEENGGQLRDSIGVGTRLSRNQGRLHRKMFKDDRASVEMFVGAGAVPQAHLEEFGGATNAPRPYARPAWDANKDKMLAGIKSDLWAEIERAAARHARKMARLARKG